MSLKPTRRTPLRSLALVGLAAAWGGCADKATALVITVQALEGIGAPTDLQVSFVHQGDFRQAVLISDDGQVFPTGGQTATFVIKADGRSGPADVTVLARDQSQRVLGKGQATVVIVAQEQVPVTIRLHPSDFQLNSVVKENQFFTTTASGRQVASDSRGNFAVVWEDSCPTGQCRVFARMFDSLGSPRLKEDTGKKDEFVASESTDNYDMPAVAMQPDGSYVIVWKRYSTAPTDKGRIGSRAFDQTGRPNTQNSVEQRLSATTGVDAVASPDIVALKGPQATYVVVWQQQSETSTHQVVGRRLDAAGRPLDTAPFLVASFTAKTVADLDCQTSTHCPTGEHCVQSKCRAIPVEPAVAPGEANGSFMVTWKQNGSLNARAYADGAQPASNAFDVAMTPTGRMGPADISPLKYGYVVIWTDIVETGGDSDGSAIRLRRFDIAGKPLEDEYTFNTTLPGNQSQPSIAMRDADGNLLAAWTSDLSTTDDPMGGIRGRLLLSNGLPLGRDFQLNTTVPDVQIAPSVAAKGGDAGAGFIIVFEDGSKAGPDTEGSGIRARLYYPGVYDARDQQIGALCASSAECGEGLFCASTHVGTRCVSTCQGAGSPCANGGTCAQPSEAAAPPICIYQTGP